MELSQSQRDMAWRIDQTLLKPYVTEQELAAFLEKSLPYGFHTIMIYSAQVPFCRPFLAGSRTNLGCVVGFPTGQTSIEAKCFEAQQAIKAGAAEIDYVINLTKLKSGDTHYIRKEMQEIVKTCHDAGKLCKVIIEACYLTTVEKCFLRESAAEVRPDFLKTSTGFGSGGATLEDIRLLTVPGFSVPVKASGGIRDAKTAADMIKAGASRIGTSAGIQIVEALTPR